MASTPLAAGIPANPRYESTAPIEFIVPAMHCAGCLSKVERGLLALPEIDHVRANLSTKRVKVVSQTLSSEAIAAAFQEIGFDAVPSDAQRGDTPARKEAKSLVTALAVAGFAMMNIMLLSVSVWAGLVTDMGEETRTLFHWISALIAIPTVAFSGRPFFRSALSALRARGMNMDVPISLAIILTTGASVLVAIKGGDHAYFDAAVMLLFFLLCGRYLDSKLREKTFLAAEALLGLKVTHARHRLSDGTVRQIDVGDIIPGMPLHILPGDRLPVDCAVKSGTSDIDMSMVTGESAPVSASPGTLLYAGTLNLSGALEVEAVTAASNSFLAQMVQIMEDAEQTRAPLVSLADKVARAYAPVVHILAATTFAGWLFLGAGWYAALMIAVAVLIITCPCALGLAVPAVQVTAVGQLLKEGIVLRSGDALDRLAHIDTAVFDKTGTLTTGEMTLRDASNVPENIQALAARLASHSHHPLAKALARTLQAHDGDTLTDVTEVPGAGMEAKHGQTGQTLRLGRRDWAAPDVQLKAHDLSELVFYDGENSYVFAFEDTLRSDAKDVIDALKARGLDVMLLSGDKSGPVATAANALGIDAWHAGQTPQDKVAGLQALKDDGKTVLMVGDGLNDAPALHSSAVSMSPSSATQITQIAADIVFQGVDLSPVLSALHMSALADRKVKQNFALALGYNLIAVPLAVFGVVTPLIAAIAMSLSSLLVTGNAALIRKHITPNT